MMAAQKSDPHLALVDAPAPAEFKPPRGPIIGASWIVRHYHTDPDTGEQLVSEKFVKQHVPGKIRLAYNRVGWFRDDVVAHYERLRRGK